MAAKISLRDVSFTYLHSHVPALKNINLEIEGGTVTAIVGPVGAGKSTLLLMLNAIIPEHVVGDLEGQVLADGLDTVNYSTEQLASHIGLVFDDPVLQITSLTVEEDVAFGPVNLGLPRPEIWDRVRTALSQVRLIGFEKRNPRQLSGGETQLLALAGIIAMRPEILVLDEPVSMLDPIGKAQVLKAIRDLNEEYGLTVIISDSGADIEAVCEFADNMVLLHKGEILLEGTPSEVFADRMLVESTSIAVPDVTQMFWEIGDSSRNPPPTKIEDAIELVEMALSEGKLKVDPVRKMKDAKELKKNRAKVINARNVWYEYPGSPPIEVLRGIDLTIHKGDMVALLGQNGSGKTTLAYNLVGVLKPTNSDAEIKIGDVDVITAPLRETIGTINYLFQNPANQLFCETFEDEVAFGPRQLGWSDEKVETAIQNSLKVVGLEELRQEYVVDLTLSEETLLSMASVLSMQPNILIADEPTGGLDLVSAQKVMELLQAMCNEGGTVIFITHDMKLAAKYATWVIVLHEGQILLEGTPWDVFVQPEILEETKLFPPQITRMCQRLGEYGVAPDVLTIDEFLEIAHGRV